MAVPLPAVAEAARPRVVDVLALLRVVVAQVRLPLTVVPARRRAVALAHRRAVAAALRRPVVPDPQPAMLRLP